MLNSILEEKEVAELFKVFNEIKEKSNNNSTNKFNKVILKMCKPFETMANNTRAKEEDPNKYEAEKVVRDCIKILFMLRKKIQGTGKFLNEKDLELFSNVKLVKEVLHYPEYKEKLKTNINNFVEFIEEIYSQRIEKLEEEIIEIEKKRKVIQLMKEE